MIPIPGLSTSLHYGNLVNRDCPLNRGLVSWWLALPSGGKGNTFFDIAGRNHGTLTNGPTWGGALGRPGGFGAIGFDGSDDMVVISSAISLRATSTLTVTAWAYAPSLDRGLILSKGLTGSGPFLEYRLMLRESGVVRSEVNNGSLQTLDSISSYSAGVWNHCAMTWDGTTLAVYLNGKQDNTVGVSGSITLTNDTVFIGGENVFNESLAGSLDSCRVYLRALSTSEILALYNDERLAYPLTINRLRHYTIFNAGGGGGVAHRLLSGSNLSDRNSLLSGGVL